MIVYLAIKTIIEILKDKKLDYLEAIAVSCALIIAIPFALIIDIIFILFELLGFIAYLLRKEKNEQK